MFRLEKFYSPEFNPQQYWDDRYAQEHVAGKDADEFKQQDIWPLLEKHLEKGKRYLDARCGIGGWTIFLNDQGFTADGIDTYARTVRALTEYNPDLHVKVADVTRIPFADNTFDGVLAIGALEYVENRVPDALKELARVTKPGGWVLIEVPVINSLRRWIYLPLKRLEQNWKKQRGKKPTFANYVFDRTELRELLKDAGFVVAEEQPHEVPGAGNHYGLYTNFPFLRGSEPYRLNLLGRLVKAISNAISPWIASTGVIVVARKS